MLMWYIVHCKGQFPKQYNIRKDMVRKCDVIHMKKKCIKCESKFKYEPDDTYWNEDGSESVKLVRCKECNCIQPIKYINMKNPNDDQRFYYYN